MINTDFYIILLENYSTIDKYWNVGGPPYVGGPRPGPTGPRPKNGTAGNRPKNTCQAKFLRGTITLH